MNPIHLCIGAPRAGTTWLFREMSEHPALFLPRVKEVRYWNNRRNDLDRDRVIERTRKEVADLTDSADHLGWLDRWAQVQQREPFNIPEYLNLMSVSGRPSLDISPAYCFLPPARIQLLRDGLPKGSKVLYLIRDPLDRLSSQVKLHFHLHGMYRGNPSTDDLAAFLDNKNQQRRWDYARVIENWAAVFGDDFIPLPFDNVVRNPRGLTSQVADLLNVDLRADNATRSDDDFTHSESNQNAQAWVTNLARPEKRQLAEAMIPAITTFAEHQTNLGQPNPAQRWLDKLHKHAAAVEPRKAPAQELPLPVQQLMRMSESLGDNCEYGFWQRHQAYEPSSLFRWAITRIEPLIAYLEKPTPLFAAADLSPHSPGMVDDASFGFKFHSKLVERDDDGQLRLLTDKAAFEAIHADEAAKIAHLQVKFLAQMKRQTGLYVIKANAGLSEDRLRHLVTLLHRHNKTHHLLWVTDNPDEDRPILADLGDGLLQASLPHFAPYTTADAYHPHGWSQVMQAVAEHAPIADQIARMQR